MPPRRGRQEYLANSCDLEYLVCSFHWGGLRRAQASRGSLDGSVVLVAESAEAFMRTAAARAYPHETGGILLGVWAERRPWVTHAREIGSPDRGPTHYVLPAGKTRALVEQMQHLDARLGYLGDWHTHPAEAAASPVDRHAHPPPM